MLRKTSVWANWRNVVRVLVEGIREKFKLR